MKLRLRTLNLLAGVLATFWATGSEGQSPLTPTARQKDSTGRGQSSARAASAGRSGFRRSGAWRAVPRLCGMR